MKLPDEVKLTVALYRSLPDAAKKSLTSNDAAEVVVKFLSVALAYSSLPKSERSIKAACSELERVMAMGIGEWFDECIGEVSEGEAVNAIGTLINFAANMHRAAQ